LHFCIFTGTILYFRHNNYKLTFKELLFSQSKLLVIFTILLIGRCQEKNALIFNVFNFWDFVLAHFEILWVRFINCLDIWYAVESGRIIHCVPVQLKSSNSLVLFIFSIFILLELNFIFSIVVCVVLSCCETISWEIWTYFELQFWIRNIV
jgi:hypothetical protein